MLSFVLIPLGGRRGGYAIIDRYDLDLVAAYNWYHDSTGYPNCSSRRGLRLHNLLLGKHVDHINGNKLDNRRKNLRLASQPLNCQNVRTAKGKYRGVYQDKRDNTWYGQVKHNNQKYSTKRFITKEEARIAVTQLRASLLPYSIN